MRELQLTPPFTADRPFRPYFLIVSSIFVTAVLIGFVAPPSVREQALTGFDAYLEQFRGMAGGALFYFILVHNVIASLLMVGAGLLFGIVPAVATCLNGFLLGVVVRQASETVGYAKTALSVVPHGVFEIPAHLFAAAYGLWLGATVIRRVRRKEETPLRFHIEHAFRRYFAVAFPLLVVAAAIETFLILTTP